MRTTGCYTLQQSLTHESASTVKQALTLARRRGHSHVTPLQVASAMLSSSTGLLRRACVQSHSHPLQCKALELCFNVALNRLPTSASSNPLLIPHSPHLPSLSNALVAAFKRAQAHQRRGSVENSNHQQHVLAPKVEIEQLLISILDDPSVSRVMREAGFSSLQVKANVEKFLTVENKALDIITKPAEITLNNFSAVFSKSENKVLESEDLFVVLESMMNEKTKNTVIVSELIATGEKLVNELIEKFDKNNVPDEMKSVQFISVPLYTLRNISKQDFEVKLGELRSLVNSCVNGGVVMYVGDLDWVSEFWSKHGENNHYFCPVEYMIMELSKLIHGEHKARLWLMGIASFKTFAKCKSGKPSLENLWSLHSLTVPAGGLSLSLSLDCGMHGKLTKDHEDDRHYCDLKMKNDQLACCSECIVNFKSEAEALMNAKHGFMESTSSTLLPPWLQRIKDENLKYHNYDYQECDETKYLCRKWNSICESVHKKTHFLEKAFDSSSPSSSTSISSESHNKIHLGLSNCSMIFKADQEHQKPELVSNPNSSPNSASSSEATDHNMEYFSDNFKQFNSDNVNTLCNALDKKVPSQTDLVPDIVNTILKCRSRIIRSKREDCWLFFLGSDSDCKETIARELAKEIFVACDDCFVSIVLSRFSSSSSSSNRAHLTEEVSKAVNNKRSRDEHGQSPFDRFVEAIRDNPSRLFFVEDINQFDYSALKGFKRAIEDGSVTISDGEILKLKDAIVVFSCDKFCYNVESADRFDHSSSMSEKEADREEIGTLLDLNVVTEDEDDDDHHHAVLDSGILGLVDKQVVFNLQVI